jgi:IS4 transposase
MQARRPLRSLVRIGRGRRRERRYKTVRHQLLHNPTVPGVLEFLGVQLADRPSQESAVQRAVHSGWLLPPERNLMRTAGWPGI